MGVEPISDGIARRSPVLKTGVVTGPHALPYLCKPKPRTDGVYIGLAEAHSLTQSVNIRAIRGLIFAPRVDRLLWLGRHSQIRLDRLVAGELLRGLFV